MVVIFLPKESERKRRSLVSFLPCVCRAAAGTDELGRLGGEVELDTPVGEFLFDELVAANAMHVI